MRCLALNIDLEQAVALRDAVGGSLGSCGCPTDLHGAPCPRCRALSAVLGELDRFVSEALIDARRSGGSPSLPAEGRTPPGAPTDRPLLSLLPSAAPRS